MLKPFLFLWLNLGSPLKLCVEFASSNPSFEFVNQYWRFSTTVGVFVSGPIALFNVISAIPLAIFAWDVLASSCHSIVSSRTEYFFHVTLKAVFAIASRAF